MAQPYSEETEELLERARRVIERSIKLREQRRQNLVNSERRLFQMQTAIRLKRAQTNGPSV
jgi:hypothetical protein